jgi:hypothetical protein
MDGEPFNNHYRYYDENDRYYDENHRDYNKEQLDYQKQESKNGFCFLLILIVIIIFMSYILPLIPCCNNNDDNNDNQENMKPLLLKKEKLEINDNENCTICLETFKLNDIISILNCNHKYHHDCIRQWTEKERSCPLCRKILL